MGSTSSKLVKSWTTRKGDFLTLHWNKVKHVSTYSIFIKRNGEESGSRIRVNGHKYSLTLRPGSKYQFLVLAGETSQIESETIFTCPSQVTGVRVRRYNGLEINWREMNDQDAKYSVAIFENGQKIDGAEYISETVFRIGYEKLHPGSEYEAEINAVSSSGQGETPRKVLIKYDKHPPLDTTCRIFGNAESIVLFFTVNKHQESFVNQEVSKFKEDGFRVLQTFSAFIDLESNAAFTTAISCYELSTIARPQSHKMQYSDLVQRGFVKCNFILVPKNSMEYTLELSIKCGKKEQILPFKMAFTANSTDVVDETNQTEHSTRERRQRRSKIAPQRKRFPSQDTSSDSGVSSFPAKPEKIKQEYKEDLCGKNPQTVKTSGPGSQGSLLTVLGDFKGDVKLENSSVGVAAGSQKTVIPGDVRDTRTLQNAGRLHGIPEDASRRGYDRDDSDGSIDERPARPFLYSTDETASYHNTLGRTKQQKKVHKATAEAPQSMRPMTKYDLQGARPKTKPMAVPS